MKPAIILQNGSKLNEQQFVHYFERKVLYTIRKFKFLGGIKQKLSIKELFLFNKIGNIQISHECLDDISVLILQAMMKNKGKQRISLLLPRYKNIIRPFYLMSREEMLLYSKIKKVKFMNNLPQITKKHKITNNIQISELNSFLDELWKNQKNIKNSIVNSLLKIENLL